MTSDISKKALDRIRQEDIRPEAEWKFILRRSLLWTGIAATAGIGAWSLSMAFFPILSLGSAIPGAGLPRFFLPFAFRPVPFIWIAFVVAFIAIAVIEFRKTGRGYRHRVAVVAAGILLPVIATAGIFHALKVNEASEREFRRRLPPYGALSVAPEDLWSRADEGFIMGTVLSEYPDGFTLRDPEGGTWGILVTEETDIRPRAIVESGSDVRIVGERKDEDTFEADEILPGGPAAFRGNGSGMGPRDGNRPPKSDTVPDGIRMR